MDIIYNLCKTEMRSVNSQYQFVNLNHGSIV